MNLIVNYISDVSLKDCNIFPIFASLISIITYLPLDD